MTEPSKMRDKERGFSILELIVAMGVTALLLTLGAGALRNYWFTQSLFGGRDELTSEFRRLQEQAVAETHPLMFGIRFRVGSSEWDAVRYDPDTTTCSVETDQRFSGGVTVSAADFAETAEATTVCRTQLAGAATDEFAFFFPRGTATGGTVTIQQPELGRSASLTVTPITGRVDEV